MAVAGPRPYSSEFSYSDREKWACLYPIYINKNRTVAQGRRIPKEKAVEDPTFTEMKEALVSLGVIIGIENKVHPRETYPRDPIVRGRIRIHFKNDDGTPKYENFPNKQSLFLKVAEVLPNTKTRQQRQQQILQQQKQAALNQQNAAKKNTGGGKPAAKGRKKR